MLINKMPIKISISGFNIFIMRLKAKVSKVLASVGKTGSSPSSRSSATAQVSEMVKNDMKASRINCKMMLRNMDLELFITLGL